MKPVVIRTGPPYYKTVYSKILALVREPYRYIVGYDYTEYVNKLSVKPMFAKKILVTVRLTDSKQRLQGIQEFIESLCSKPWIIIVVLCDSIKMYNSWTKYFTKAAIEYLSYNGYLATDSEKIEYIQEEIKQQSSGQVELSYSSAEEILKASRFTPHKLEQWLLLLSKTKCSAFDIQKICRSEYHITLKQLPISIFRGRALSDVRRLILDHRYSQKYILKDLKDFTGKLYSLYGCYLSGELCENNVETWVIQRGDAFDIKSKYQAENFLEILGRISFDKFLAIRNFIMETLDSDSYKCTARLLKLVSLVNG